jgi:DNA invertase Pin-like site-specific DNA recombinase
MSPADKNKPLIAYLRQSRTKERSISLDEQRDAIKQWANVKGETVVFDGRYVERSVSGAKPWHEREIGNAIKTLQAGEASGIVCAYQDRLARPTWKDEADVWDALAQADGRLVCAAEGTDFRPGDAEATDARLLYRIKAATARHQWERHCRNWEKGKHNAWLEGRYNGGTPPGFDRADGLKRGQAEDVSAKNKDGRLVPNKDAAAIRQAFELKASGGSALEVAKMLMAAGVRLYSGSLDWSRQSARNLLRNEVYKGEHHCPCGCDQSVYRPGWDILTPEGQDPALGRLLWKKAQPGTGKRASRGDGYVLGEGLCRCEVCGAGLHKSSTGKKYPFLRCEAGRGGRHPSISYPKALDWIVGVAFAHGVGWTVERSGGNAAEVEAADAALAQARADLAEVEALRGTVKPAALAVALSDAQVALEAAEDACAALTVEVENVTLLTALGSRQKFEALPVPEQRRVLRQIVSRVVVKPGRAHVSDRIEITFADGSVYPTPYNPDAVPAIAREGVL